MLHLAFFILLYFLPAIIGRDKHDAASIFLLNFFVGWTVIGWVIALIWACTAKPAFRLQMIPVAAGARFCCRCGVATCPGARYCAACGYGV
jgi:Superinfection immunity protein